MENRTHGILLIFLSCWIIGIFWCTSIGFAQQTLELKPNVQPFPAFDLVLVSDSQGGTHLRFSVTSWNKGDGRLELRAGELVDAPTPTNPGNKKQKVYQRVYRTDGSYYDQLAGTFVWHEGHNHFHFDDYALYTLQPFNAPGGSQRTSSKTTFCIMDTTQVNTSLPGAPASAVYTTCSSTVQGMSVGWGDTYGWNLAGQSFDFTGNPSGDYKLIVEIDPQKRLLEIDDGDNTSCALLRINVANSTVQALGSGCDTTVSSIQPNSVRQGSSVHVTIKGDGFTNGMGVTFENGSGASPIARNVTFRDVNTIEADVTVKKGGPKSTRFWDVRVSSGVLFDGFMVRP
jgi:hypothetical protein